jgi:hypothetical protein
MDNANEAAKSRHGEPDWWEDRSLPQKILIVAGFILLGIGLLFAFGWVVMLLWNWLMPDIFGLKQISYWQAWGLLALCTILFKGFGGGSGNTSDRKRKRTLRRYIREECRTADNGETDPAGSAPDGRAPN